jgi:hypothetical protein
MLERAACDGLKKKMPGSTQGFCWLCITIVNVLSRRESTGELAGRRKMDSRRAEQSVADEQSLSTCSGPTRVDECTTERSPGSGEPEDSVAQAFRTHGRVLIWCVYAIWVMVASSFTSTVGNSVLSIPRFRKDFGRPFDSNFVLSAKWQSAYYGATGAG